MLITCKSEFLNRNGNKMIKVKITSLKSTIFPRSLNNLQNWGTISLSKGWWSMYKDINNSVKHEAIS